MMINIKAKAKELDIEPNVTGFEEAMALEYPRKREGKYQTKLDIARKLPGDGVDVKIISRYTGVSIEDLKRKL